MVNEPDKIQIAKLIALLVLFLASLALLIMLAIGFYRIARNKLTADTPHG